MLKKLLYAQLLLVEELKMMRAYQIPKNMYLLDRKLWYLHPKKFNNTPIHNISNNKNSSSSNSSSRHLTSKSKNTIKFHHLHPQLRVDSTLSSRTIKFPYSKDFRARVFTSLLMSLNNLHQVKERKLFQLWILEN